MSESSADTLKSLWAPWRVDYFRIVKDGRNFMLDAARTSDDAAHLVVVRLKSVFLMLNRYPYAVGHLMAVPYREVSDLGDLSREERSELLEISIYAQKLLRRVANAQGFNIGLNLGACAGAGYANHLHMHIVPRWEADNNFMPVLANTRIMPEALQAMYAKLVKARDEIPFED